MALRVDGYISDSLGKCLEYSDNMDAVCCKPKGKKRNLVDWLGVAKSSFGPIPPLKAVK